MTTVVVSHENAAALDERWSGEDMPGPRVLQAASIEAPEDTLPWLITLSGDMNAGMEQRDTVSAWQKRGVPVLAETWQAATGSGAALLLGGNTLPASPDGHRYQDIDLAGSPVTIVSGLADASTPGIDSLMRSRQVGLLPASSAATAAVHDDPEPGRGIGHDRDWQQTQRPRCGYWPARRVSGPAGRRLVSRAGAAGGGCQRCRSAWTWAAGRTLLRRAASQTSSSSTATP